MEPLTSSADGVGTWPETASAVAVRFNADEHIDIVAPCGLEDLFELRWRRNPRRVTIAEYQRRLATKRIAERWPLASVFEAREPRGTLAASHDTEESR